MDLSPGPTARALTSTCCAGKLTNPPMGAALSVRSAEVLGNPLAKSEWLGLRPHRIGRETDPSRGRQAAIFGIGSEMAQCVVDLGLRCGT